MYKKTLLLCLLILPVLQGLEVEMVPEHVGNDEIVQFLLEGVVYTNAPWTPVLQAVLNHIVDDIPLEQATESA